MDTERLIKFVCDHRDEDPLRLLLQKERYPELDMELVAQQLEGQRQASAKWPTLAGCQRYLYPPRLNREQSSSEATARYKRELVGARLNGPVRVADLTGGMGIDSMALAKLGGSTVDYVERDAALCRLMEHNADVLGLGNINVHCDDSLEWLARQEGRFDLVFLDPARRDGQGRKVAAFEDCTPDISSHIGLLRQKARLLLVKASPMMDLDAGMRLFGSTVEAYVVALEGECKEVLYLWDPERGPEAPLIHCVALSQGTAHDFAFSREEERQCDGHFATHVERYLYEPDAALMKGGAFKLISERYEVAQLGRNTRLYTSEALREWPRGRRLEVLAELPLNRKAVAKALPEGRAHVVVRNYPVGADALQKQLGLKEGGSHFVVATTVGTKKQGLLCRSL